VLKRLAEQDLLKGKTLGIDASTREADAAMKSIVRRDTGETYQEFIKGLATASGIETPTAAELANFDRQRKDKSVGNDDWHIPHESLGFEYSAQPTRLRVRALTIPAPTDESPVANPVGTAHPTALLSESGRRRGWR